jgi:hypothetical protein
VRTIKLIALTMALAFICMGLQAQTRYTCRYNGGSYQSTQPCPGTSVGGSDLVYHGPVTPPPPRYEPQTAPCDRGTIDIELPESALRLAQ